MDHPATSAQCIQFIRLSCTKIIAAKSQKGGAKLHRNLLIIHMVRRAKDYQNKLEDLEASTIETDDDAYVSPPLEFSVRDCDSETELCEAADEPLAFACEATEDIDDMANRCDRKRKAESRTPPYRKKTASDRAVPQLHSALVCK
ncbi:unnamed protein product [Angiostrongylus costaricensis]|uniref:Dimer_Tnp_hAT domain-containing protein n=1 Tax=Angiostrongylus costaricensis TaxID=334426 RepID=A0A0R3PL44_ANGCS|nr:unnamed protein product [Angiostrongylus costaricensis]